MLQTDKKFVQKPQRHYVKSMIPGVLYFSGEENVNISIENPYYLCNVIGATNL